MKKITHNIFERGQGVVRFSKKIQILMEKRAPRNGCFLINFVTFTSNHV